MEFMTHHTLEELRKAKTNDCPICLRPFIHLTCADHNPSNHSLGILPEISHGYASELANGHTQSELNLNNKCYTVPVSGEASTTPQTPGKWCYQAVTVQACGHTFGKTCITDWLSSLEAADRIKTCPVCPIEIRFTYDALAATQDMRRWTLAYAQPSPQHRGLSVDALHRAQQLRTHSWRVVRRQAHS
ncbi:hypothetical protein GTA08_BOTSDO06500 [Botryosphaeria dothidea]|uniref:Zinc finger C3HC4 RING-type domain-containing protein n=1 Tax=Botryosphaeria dothidea TaxID=55169 RepID=A0A8H4IVJ9_9PEZI|nr:hypothetical protein GTA08_BOTSDO06500 [Botryosphaeria dothidea]